MCYEEFIAYQCGHRSMGVVRPCPMTTAGHNFPVCGIPSHKPHYAETMCTPCERQLHSRWVLIREWEHRWLHERGVCGCEVIFPGLLTTPRVIGDTSAAGAADSTAGPGSPTDAEDDKHSTPRATTTAEGSKDAGSETSQGDVEKTISVGGDGRIPALFAEGVTSTGEHHVAVRLPSLYAAEWHADHAALHHAGKCNCAATFTPYKPQIGEDELTPHDRDTLRQWRQREAAKEKTKHGARDVDGQTDETTKRIAEIKKEFGEFEVDDEGPKVKLPRLPATAATDSQPAGTRGQGNTNFRHFNRRAGARNLPPRPQSQPTPPFTPAGSQSQPQPQNNQLVLASQPSPSPHTHNQIYTHPFTPTHHRQQPTP
ncbi:hypothetical protein C8A01DRAFT_38718, partial [Parachaetomium inaequale]